MENRLNDLEMPRPAAATNLYVEVAHSLRSLIVERKMKPGDRLPSERVLAQQLQVGRPVVRDALRILETLGLIGVSPRQGSYVKQPDLARCMEAVVDSVARAQAADTSWRDNLLEAHLILEAEETGLAARRATAEDRQSVQAALQALREAVSDPTAFPEAERQFAQAVARAAHNPIMAGLASGVAGLCHNGNSDAHQDDAAPRLEALRHYEKVAGAILGDNVAGAPEALGFQRHRNGRDQATAA